MCNPHVEGKRLQEVKIIIWRMDRNQPGRRCDAELLEERRA
jgi:hypothetical protein